MGQAAQLGQQGSDHGQYGQTPMATPYGMDGVADANAQQNENTQSTNDYDPILPQSTLTQGQQKQWYPGMYPSSQPQFGANPYSPQTFNIQGHPGQNQSRIANVEPNQPNDAYSNEGQFQQVKTMAGGGKSTPTTPPVNGGFVYTDPARTWAGPVSVNSPSYQTTQQDPMATLLSGKGAASPISSKGPVGSSSANPILNGLGKGPATPAPTPTPAPVAKQPSGPVYVPQYTQDIRNKPNVDSYGMPIFNNGGLASIPRK
jgi:hypothetical protein